MNRYIKQMFTFVTILFCALFAYGITAYASTANIDIPAQNTTKGSEVKVAINVTSDQNIGTFDLRITYDTKILEYVSGADNGGSGVLQVLNSDLNQTTTVSKEITFKALKDGACAISVQPASSKVLDMSANPMDIAGENGTITVAAGEAASSDNSLTSLKVSAVNEKGKSSEVILAPEFSADVTDYKLNVNKDITKLSVAVTTADVSAATKISGTKLDMGDNLTTISVTAGSGEVKTYKIYTSRGATEKPTSSAGDDGNKNVTPLPEDLSPKMLDGVGKYIIQNFDSVGIPQGFTAQGYKYKDKTFASLISDKGSIVLMCLADDDQGKNQALFVYNSDKDSFSLFNNLSVTDNVYTMLVPGNNVKVPDGFAETNIKINEIDTISWTSDQLKGYSLIYAANKKGEKNFYLYDNEEKNVIKYPSSGISSVSNQGDNSKSLQKQHRDDNIVKIEIAVCFGIVCIIMIIYICYLLSKIKKLNTGDEEDDIEDQEKEESETPKELKLDMAIHVNEVTPETLASDVNSLLEENSNNDAPDIQNESNDDNIKIDSEVSSEVLENQPPEERQDDDMDIVFVDLEDGTDKK